MLRRPPTVKNTVRLAEDSEVVAVEGRTVVRHNLFRQPDVRRLLVDLWMLTMQ